jgi:hypothetical protein
MIIMRQNVFFLMYILLFLTHILLFMYRQQSVRVFSEGSVSPRKVPYKRTYINPKYTYKEPYIAPKESYKRTTYHCERGLITPVELIRHYVDFIQQFVRVFSEKRAEIEDQQLHLNNGLQRLSETQAALQEMSVSLGAKGEELARKEAEANDKLQAMVQDQQVAINPAPCTLHPEPYILHPAPYILHPAPCTLHTAFCTLHTPYTPHSESHYPAPTTLEPKP